jgi:stage V sporulation protein B
LEPKVKPENFMRGAMLITAGALISRVLGAVYRPVTQHFLGDVGLGLVTGPGQAYQFMLAISAVGLNVAISRLLAERLALEDYRGARHVFRVATQMLIISGILFSLLFALGARWMANAMAVPEAWIGFMVLSPAIFLVTLSCAFRGLYQGMQQMAPSAISQVVEQVGRVSLGLAAVALLSPIALSYGAAAFNGGNTIGVFMGVLYGGWIYFREKPTAGWTTTAPGVESYEHESTTRLMGKILSIALPLSVLGAVQPIIGLVDASVVTNQLIAIGQTKDAAQAGLAYLVNAGQLRDLPTILTTALYVSLVPAVTESVATGRLDQARYRSSSALRLSLLFGLPATAGLLFGARDAYSVLYTGPGFIVMGPLAWSTIFLMVQQTTSGVLQGMGLIWTSVRNLLVGVVLKTVLTYWWTGIPSLNVNGAAYATVVAFVVAAGLNLWVLRRELGLTVNLKDDVGRPGIAALIMGLVILLASPIVHRIIHSGRLAGAVVVGIGGLVYLVAILLVGGVTEADLGMIPGVKARWIEGLKRYRLLRA